MKRWEHFNKICGREDSLQKQINEILAEKIKELPDVDCAGLEQHVRAWLEEDVGVII